MNTVSEGFPKLKGRSFFCPFGIEATVFLQVNDGQVPVGKHLLLPLLEILLKKRVEIEESLLEKDRQRIHYGKGIFRLGIYFDLLYAASYPRRAIASRPKLLSADTTQESCLDRILNKKEIDKIAETIGVKWKTLASSIRPISLKAEEISCLEALHSGDSQMQCKAMLRFWSQNNDQATVKNLCLSLLEVGCLTEAMELFPDATKELKQRDLAAFPC
eukprot:m.109860 g.109860  ORF g.109860 m.109860 type:complete len:217 (+) comp37372_c0_seq2:879-1529(+)